MRGGLIRERLPYKFVVKLIENMIYIYLFRYGGLSFGSKMDISDRRSEHISSIIQSLISINLTDHTLNKEHVKIWSTVMGLKTRFTTKNINKVSCHLSAIMEHAIVVFHYPSL